MKRLFMWSMFFAPDGPNAGSGAGQVLDGMVESLDNAKLEVLDNFVMPVSTTGRGGARGTKYLPQAILDQVYAMKPTQTSVIPFLKNDNVIDAANRQKNVTKTLLNKWAAQHKDGEITPKFSTAIVEKGIAVRRDV